MPGCGPREQSVLICSGTLVAPWTWIDPQGNAVASGFRVRTLAFPASLLLAPWIVPVQRRQAIPKTLALRSYRRSDVKLGKRLAILACLF